MRFSRLSFRRLSKTPDDVRPKARTPSRSQAYHTSIKQDRSKVRKHVYSDIEHLYDEIFTSQCRLVQRNELSLPELVPPPNAHASRTLPTLLPMATSKLSQSKLMRTSRQFPPVKE